MDFLLCGKGISETSFILSGSIYMPSLDTTNPTSFPSLRAKNDFFGFKEIPYLLHRSKICFKSCRWLALFFENVSPPINCLTRKVGG